MAYAPFLYRLSRSSASLDSLSCCFPILGRHTADLRSQARWKSTASTSSNDGENASDSPGSGTPYRTGMDVFVAAVDVSSFTAATTVSCGEIKASPAKPSLNQVVLRDSSCSMWMETFTTWESVLVPCF